MDRELHHEIPALTEFEPNENSMLILEDLNYFKVSKEQKGMLKRLYVYASTHKNVSCMLPARPPKIRFAF